MLEYMLGSGFLKSRTFFYMDCIAIYMVLLPILVGIAVFFVMKGRYKLHQFSQSSLFFITSVLLGLFFYEIYVRKGFDNIVVASAFSSEILAPFLNFYIVLVLITLVMWFSTLTFAKSDRKRRALPGVYSPSHKKSGRRVGVAIFLTSLTGSTFYWMLFIA